MQPEQRDRPAESLVGCEALDAGEMLRVEDPRSVLVHVAQGQVWITEERCDDDIVRDAGGWYRLTRPGIALVQALLPTVVLLTAPQEQPAAAIRRLPPHAARATTPRAPQPRPAITGGQGLALPTAATR